MVALASPQSPVCIFTHTHTHTHTHAHIAHTQTHVFTHLQCCSYRLAISNEVTLEVEAGNGQLNGPGLPTEEHR